MKNWMTIQQERIADDMKRRINKVLEHGQYIMGPEVKELEEKLAYYVGVEHAVSCSSGTDALMLALMAYGVGPKSTIITTPFTFIATAEVAALLGADIMFVDIDPVTFNIDPDKLEHTLEIARPEVHTGVIAVDLFGLPADYERLRSICAKYGVFIIEDGAQSFGGELLGDKTGSLTVIGCTSFFPAKPFGCYGDGGMCFTNARAAKDVMESFRVHGKGKYKYENVRVGLNARLDTLQAAILLSKLEIFHDEVEKRQEVAKTYNVLLTDSDLTLPTVPEGYKSAWAQYSVLAENEHHREKLREKLMLQDIPCPIYYPKPLHLQEAFKDLGYSKGSLPISEDYAKRIFILPMNPYITLEEQVKVSKTIERT